MDFSNLTINQAKELLDSGKTTSVELTKYYLEKINKENPELNAFITITADVALEQAKKADDLRQTESDKTKFMPLLGIPYAVKDSFNITGIKTTAGSKMLENFVSPYNATVIQRLEDAGAVLLGKTNMDAWGHGSSTENSDFGVTKNPTDHSKVAGGSSGGSAAAVAADMCVFAIGEDTGGSIRQPAGFCGVYGLKVTYGKVSRYGCVAYASSLDTIGPMAKNAEDIGIILDVIKGSDNHDATVQELESRKEVVENISQEKNLSKIRFALPQEYVIEGMDPEVTKAMDVLKEKITQLGGVVSSESIPSTKYAIPTYYIIAMAETSTNLARYDGIRYGKHVETGKGWIEDVLQTRTQGFSPEAKRRIMLGSYVLSAGYADAYYKKAQKVRTKLISEFDKVFQDFDVIISPISPSPAFSIGENTSDPVKMYLEDVYTVTANLVGVPSLAIPVTKSSSGLPIGLQLIGPKWSEDMLTEIARVLES